MQLLILQHPREPRQPRGTVPLIQAVLPSTIVRTGMSWANLVADSKRWGVLYLGTGLPIPNRLPADPIVFSVSKNKKITPLAPPVHLDGLILLDGNWKQAKTLWWRNSWLLKLQRLAILPHKPSSYSVVRREPRRECLSTIEAAALSFELLAGDTVTAGKLRDAFSDFLKIDKPSIKQHTENLCQKRESPSSFVGQASKMEVKFVNQSESSGP